jgi:two-component system cell cycle response regulator
MDKQTRQIRVGWCSSMEIPPVKGFELTAIQDVTAGYGLFDVVVLDVRLFESIPTLKKTYLDRSSARGSPTVLIVDNDEQENAILDWLASADEICRRETVSAQLGSRLRRCMSRHTEKSNTTNIDTLTGLANRDGLRDYVEMVKSSEVGGTRFALILVELDHFKEINDKYNHTAGDRILVEIGHMLQRLSAGAGIVARIGGDEFAIAVPGNLEQGCAFADFLRTEIEVHRFMADDNSKIAVTCSAGVAFGTEESSFEDLLRQIEQYLYAAKQQGRNRVVSAREFDALVDAAGEDALIADFENRIRVTAERMSRELVLKARRVANEYRSEADHDGLTGIFNRRHLDRLLGRLMEKCRRDGQSLALALLDLDRFGEVNKTYGFPTGDRALKTAASVIEQSVRATDWVARYGGEEFCVVLPLTDLDAARDVAERIRQSLSRESIATHDGRQFQITTSIGVVQLGPADTDAVSFIQRASDRVSEAKKEGRNCVRF